jgi:hypothetical protein
VYRRGWLVDFFCFSKGGWFGGVYTARGITDMSTVLILQLFCFKGFGEELV